MVWGEDWKNGRKKEVFAEGWRLYAERWRRGAIWASRMPMVLPHFFPYFSHHSLGRGSSSSSGSPIDKSMRTRIELGVDDAAVLRDFVVREFVL